MEGWQPCGSRGQRLTLHPTYFLFRFGGKYVPETLIPALEELEQEYKKAIADPEFQVRMMFLMHQN